MKEQTRGKRLLSILLACIMMISLVPSTVFAVSATSITLTDASGNQEVISETQSGSGWEYNASSCTLTLNGWSGQKIYANGDFNLHLKGTNTITMPNTENTAISGIEANGGSGTLTVTGETTGKLIVKCEGFKNTNNAAVNSFNVGTLNINSGEVEISMKPADGHSRAVWGLYNTVYLKDTGSLKIDVDGTANNEAVEYAGTWGTVLIESGAPKLDVTINAPNNKSADRKIPAVRLYVKNAAPQIDVTVSDSATDYAVDVTNLDLTSGGYLSFSGGKLISNGLRTGDYTALTAPVDAGGVYKFVDKVLCKNDGTAITSGKFEGQTAKVPIRFTGGTVEDGVVTYTLPELKVGVPATHWKGFIYLLDYVAGCSSPKFEITGGTLPAGLELTTYTGGIGQQQGENKPAPTETTPAGSVTIKVSDDYDATRTPAICKVKWDAVKEADKFITIDGTKYLASADHGSDSGVFKWDSAAKTLTLNNYNGGPISSEVDFNLHLKGTNTITTPTTPNTAISGIEANGGSGTLTVTGETTGKLIVKCEGFKNTNNAEVNSFNVGTLTINSGAVEISMKPADGHRGTVCGLYSTVYLKDTGSLKIDVDGTANNEAVEYAGTWGTVLIESGAPKLDVTINAPNNKGADRQIPAVRLSVKNAAPQIDVTVSDSATDYAVNVTNLGLTSGGYLSFSGGKLISNGLTTGDYTALTEPADADGSYRFVDGVLCKDDGTAITSGKFEGQTAKVPIRFTGGIVEDGVVTYTLPELKVGVPASHWHGFIRLWSYVIGCSSPKFEITEGTLPAGLELTTYTGGIGQHQGENKPAPTETTPAGSVTIKVSDDYDATRTPAICKVKWAAITRVNPVQSITLSQESVVLDIDGTTKVDATVSPTDASYANLKVVSNNTGVATASVGEPDENGKSEVVIEAKGTGVAIITVTSLDTDVSKIITVNVREAMPNASISADKTMLEGLTPNATYSISGTDLTETDYPADVQGRIAILEAWHGKTINIVKKGANDTLNSAAKTLSIDERPAAPNATIDYSAKTITLIAGTYTINGTATTVAVPISIDAAWFGSTVPIVKLGENGGINSAPNNLAIPAIPAAPNGLTATPAYNGANGAIVGGTTHMEYRLKDSANAWVAIHSETTSVPAGIYEVRYQATDDAFASNACEIAVNAEIRKHDAPDPSSFTITDATNPIAPDGRIDGILEGTHEYRLKGTTEWQQVTGNSVSVLPGTYEIRVKETDTHYQFNDDGTGALLFPTESYEFTYKIRRNSVSIDYENEELKDVTFCFFKCLL